MRRSMVFNDYSDSSQAIIHKNGFQCFRPCKESCVSDTARKCPYLWTLSTDGLTCIAPYSYLGEVAYLYNVK